MYIVYPGTNLLGLYVIRFVFGIENFIPNLSSGITEGLNLSPKILLKG